MSDRRRKIADRTRSDLDESSVSNDDERTLAERCDRGRETMSPRETADCAGLGLGDQYDNEEDGGS